MDRLKHHNFSWLSQYDTNWAIQQSVRKDRALSFMACLFHYNMDVAHIMRFAGNNYTGAYRKATDTAAFLLGKVMTTYLPDM